ncbi:MULTISPECIES: nuclear transport factor 2 family protein [Clostridium]|uniref:nuclear transport factor 2 family protein n=1 Tax=Clostridium TaxID=1485 RepID=UPI000287C2E1|nr:MULTISPECIES: nuclear transport factor 2 family protein [Clostridium]MDF2504007.1 hypothetical protein [Clostridium sp.]
MKRNLIVIIIAAVVSISLVGCGASNSSEKKDTKQATKKESSVVNVNDNDIIKLINDKTKAINDKNLNNYLDTFVKDTDTYNKEKLDKKDYIDNFKVKAEVSNPKVLNVSDKQAQVQYVVNTTKINGPGFLDNKSLYVDNLKKVDNKWKIDSEDVLNVEFKDDIYETVYDNIQALNEKDINKYMGTIDSSNTDDYNKFKENQLDIFDKYDLSYNLEEADVFDSKSDKDTAVGFIETIVKRDNSDFKNNKTTGVMHLKKINNQWKIFKIDIQKTEDIK